MYIHAYIHTYVRTYALRTTHTERKTESIRSMHVWYFNRMVCPLLLLLWLTNLRNSPSVVFYCYYYFVCVFLVLAKFLYFICILGDSKWLSESVFEVEWFFSFPFCTLYMVPFRFSLVWFGFYSIFLCLLFFLSVVIVKVKMNVSARVILYEHGDSHWLDLTIDLPCVRVSIYIYVQVWVRGMSWRCS